MRGGSRTGYLIPGCDGMGAWTRPEILPPPPSPPSPPGQEEGTLVGHIAILLQERSHTIHSPPASRASCYGINAPLAAFSMKASFHERAERVVRRHHWRQDSANGPTHATIGAVCAGLRLAAVHWARQGCGTRPSAAHPHGAAR